MYDVKDKTQYWWKSWLQGKN